MTSSGPGQRPDRRCRDPRPEAVAHRGTVTSLLHQAQQEIAAIDAELARRDRLAPVLGYCADLSAEQALAVWCRLLRTGRVPDWRLVGRLLDAGMA